MRTIRYPAASVATLALCLVAGPALAQSAGTLDFDKEIVVTGGSKKDKAIEGVAIPDTSKAKAQLTQAWIAHETPGQSINNTINYLPGVSFQNSDPFGFGTGVLTIRGFDATRISETFDGMTLNDDGNYALYSGELLDSEVIDSVTVNLGTTDVDAPTTSASGSTVNYLSHMPSNDFHLRGQGSAGSDNFHRLFGMVETGEFTPAGTKAWFSASTANSKSPYNNFSHNHKDQFNGKIYQPLGNNGDFLSLAGFYIRVRNNFSGYAPLANTPLTADTGVGYTSFPTSYNGAYYQYQPCTVQTATAGKKDTANTCGSAYDYRDNPDNLANLRASMRVHLSDNVVFTADPSYQFTKANGGGTATVSEATSNGSVGYINGTYYAGKDLNGDGDTLDTVRVAAPSETMTHRLALTSSLRWDFAEKQSVRLAYAFSRSVIAQTGELAALNSDGTESQVFAADNAITDSAGNDLEKRDTRSIAMLNQVSAEYRGTFLDDKLTANIGVRAPFMHRDLTNYCFTRSSSGSVSCVFGASEAAYAAANTSAAAPQRRTYNYNAVLPNVGFTYKLPAHQELFFNYSMGLSAPQTTALYQSFYYNTSNVASLVTPEKTSNFDLGYRYNTSKISAQLDAWYTHYTNRLGSAYNPNDQTSVYTNLGTVNRFGLDGNVAYRMTPNINAYAFGSWLHSRISSNVYGTQADGTTGLLQTAGKFESGVPIYTVGGRLEGHYGALSGGIQGKYTAARYVDDQNLPYYLAGTHSATEVYGAKTPGYMLVDLDIKYALTASGLGERSFVQLNVSNLFNKYYVAGFLGTYNNQISYTGTYTQAQIGSPRALIATLNLAY